MIVIAIASPKGGVTKSWSTLSLAAEYSQKGFRVLIVDGDGSRNATVTAIEDLDALEYSLEEVFANPRFDVRKAIYPCSDEFPNVHVLAGSKALEKPQSVMAGRKNVETVLKRALRSLNEEFDLVLVDTPANMNIVTENALAACDAYLCPIDHDRHAIDGFLGIQEMVESMVSEQVIDNKPKCLGFFFTKVEEGARVTRLVDKAVQQLIKEGILAKKHLINIRMGKSIHPKEAGFHGTTLQFNRSHPVCKNYVALAKFIQKNIDIPRSL